MQVNSTRSLIFDENSNYNNTLVSSERLNFDYSIKGNFLLLKLSWRSAVTPIAPKDIQSLLFWSSTTFVQIAEALSEFYPRFQRFPVVFVTHYKQPCSNFRTCSMANFGIVQPYTSAKEAFFPQISRNATRLVIALNCMIFIF